jgi:putative ABC transport system substrate-binding protein
MALNTASLSRRRFLAWLTIGAGLTPVLATVAEGAGIPRIGVLVPALGNSPLEQGLRDGLRQLGYIEGKSIVIEWRRYTRADQDLQALATELAESGVDLILTSGSPATQAALQATTGPVVFTVVGDPVGTKFAASLASPGGHATGVSVLSIELIAKRLELLHQMVPHARRVLYLMNSANPINARVLEEVQAAARTLGLKLVTMDARDAAEIDAAFRTRSHKPTDAVLIAADYLFVTYKGKIAENVRKLRLPAMVASKENLDDGLLMSYGPNLSQVMKRAALYVDKILKGAQPRDLPIEQISTYEFIIDLRAARALRLTAPQQLLLRADEVIQ